MMDVKPSMRSAPRGIALILVSGVIVVLALAASLFLQMILFQGRSREGLLAAHRAELAAESGMEYSAARLTREKPDMSAPRVPSARADDWQYRGGGEYRREPGDDFAAYPVPEPLSQTQNPSWSHGEAWADAPGGAAGAFDEGEETGGAWTDLDRDGRFSAWSGRLRGGRGALDTRFSLKVEPGPTSRLNVNYGDLDGGGGPAWSGEHYGFGTIMEGRDCTVARGLNVLGVVLGMGNLVEIPANPGAGADYKVVRVSDLGNRLLANRPTSAGYRSMDEVRQALSTGPAPLTDAQWRVLEPHLTLVQYDYGHPAFMPNDLLDYQGAPAALLHSHWMYRLGQARSAYLSYDLAGDLLLSATGTPEPDPWIGRNFGQVTTLFPEEIRPLVQGIVERRRSGAFENFDTLYRHVLTGMQAAGHAPAGATPLERSFFLARKADFFMLLARREARPECHLGFDSLLPPPCSWASRGLDRNPGAPGDQTESGLVRAMGECGFDIPQTLDAYIGTEPYDLPISEPFGPPLGNPYAGFWFGPIRTFRVACRSAAGREDHQAVHMEEGDFLAGIGLRFQSQDHFENLSSRRTAASPDILPERPLEMERDVLLYELGTFSGTQSLPYAFPGKSFWRSGTPPLPALASGDSGGGVTLAEGEPDFTLPPMIRWEFTPDTAFDAAGTDGPEHARGTGLYPFGDNSPLALFGAGDLLLARSGGQTTGTDLALEMASTVGVRFNANAPGPATALMTTTDRGPMHVSQGVAPPVIQDPARVPAPLPMMPFPNSDGVMIGAPVPSPQTTAEAATNWSYAPHGLQSRWFLEGGFEAWVTQASFAGGATVPLVKVSAGGNQWSDNPSNPLARGGNPQEVSLELGLNMTTFEPEYRLVSRYLIPAARTFSPNGGPGGNPSYQLRPTGYFKGPGLLGLPPAVHVVTIPLPDRGGALPGGHYDHFLVEWKVLQVQRFDLLDPQKQTHAIGDPMPRVEVALRITLNGVVVHEQAHVTRLSYRLNSLGNIATDLNGFPQFNAELGFFPPMGRCNNGQDSYLDVEMHHCDQVALHNVYRPVPSAARVFRDRFRPVGTYASPRLVFGRGATLRWAGWTAAMGRALREAQTPPVSCEIQGYADAAGGSPSGGPVPAGSLAAPSAWLDAPRCRSARFNVRFQVPSDPGTGQVFPSFCDDPVAPSPGPAGGTGAFTDPPVFEEFLLFVTDHPRWLTR